jgi:hypothetical protein
MHIQKFPSSFVSEKSVKFLYNIYACAAAVPFFAFALTFKLSEDVKCNTYLL